MSVFARQQDDMVVTGHGTGDAPSVSTKGGDALNDPLGDGPRGVTGDDSGGESGGNSGGESGGGEVDAWLARLRPKWSTVPAAGPGRVDTRDLLAMSDHDLVAYWHKERQAATTGPAYSGRGWYHELYKDALRGKKVLDVGAGLGFDAFTFAQAGAELTLLDIVPTNVDLHRRLAQALGIRVEHFWLNELADLDQLSEEFDVIWAQGSMHHSPYELIRRQARSLLEHLRIGGRWIELAYPKERWERDGRPAFEKWGQKTDGPGTPWAEWYDLEKLLGRLAPARFDTVLAFNFRDNEFSWYDLVRTA